MIARNAFGFGGAERTVDVLVAYRDERETDQEISVDYLVTGTGRKALYVAMKTPTALLASNLPVFEDVLGTSAPPGCARDLSRPLRRPPGPPDGEGERALRARAS